ncbi:hypothetical protein DFH06DRAFT_1240886 [Mycena polygramma]|nr:hypothetical protein DFH06DRAFT_1240886 [Mycena polygramma]
MKRAGHVHDYRISPDVGAWVMMRAVLSPELSHDGLACFHWNDEDGCSLCDARLKQKIQSDIGHSPPLHLLALWHVMQPSCFDPARIFRRKLAFAVIQRPELFEPYIVKRVQEFVAQRYPERVRQKFYLHNDREDPPPSWKHLEDLIESLRNQCHLDMVESFEPTSWFDMLLLLVDKCGEKQSVTTFCQLWPLQTAKLFGERLPALNLRCLPEYAQHAVERYCRATYHRKHTCGDYDGAVEHSRRYAAAHALLYCEEGANYATPLLTPDRVYPPCDACTSLTTLYKLGRRADAISAGEILVESDNWDKVLNFIDRLVVSHCIAQILSHLSSPVGR